MVDSKKEKGTTAVKVGLAQMQKYGVIMDVVNEKQARIAQKAGAVAVMALEKIPADVRASGGVARTAPLERIEKIMKAVSIPVMAKVRIGHYLEAKVLENYKKLEIDFIDESEVLSPVDYEHHINKHDFNIPFVCGARDLGEALRRIDEGAAMIRTKGEPGTGDVMHAVTHMRKIRSEIAELVGYYRIAERLSEKNLQLSSTIILRNLDSHRKSIEKDISKRWTASLSVKDIGVLVGLYEMGEHYRPRNLLDFHDEIIKKARELKIPYETAVEIGREPLAENITIGKEIGSLFYHLLLSEKAEEMGVPNRLVWNVAKNKALPVPNFAAGGIATPQDAALMMYMGADGIFVGSGIFKSRKPLHLARKIVEATKNFYRFDLVADSSRDFGEPMGGTSNVSKEQMMQYKDAGK